MFARTAPLPAAHQPRVRTRTAPQALLWSVPGVVKTSFERFEYKYWVTEDEAREVVRIAAPHLRPDSHGRPGEGQRNVSLYLDSPDLDFLKAHVDSEPDRFKLRVRTYGDRPMDVAFFEVKRKVKAVIAKRRAVVPREIVRDLLDGSYLAVPPLPRAQDAATLSAFLYKAAVHQVEPQVIISANREAWASIDPEEDVRLTVDREVCWQTAREPDLVWDEGAWRSVPRPVVSSAGASAILELKFRGMAPWWMERIVDCLGLRQTGFSKYVAAMQAREPDAADADEED